MTAEVEKNNYQIKVDDMLLYLLKEYHDIDASDALTFFSERVVDMKYLEPNVNSKSWIPKINYSTMDGRTSQGKFGHGRYGNNDTAKFYVLRGFYPDSNIPFKMVAVYSTDKSHEVPYAHSPVPAGIVMHVKVMIGMRPHWSSFNSKTINKYKESVCESIMLDQPVLGSDKIDYKYRDFKCMRPKGMPLYRERNYKEKQLEKNRISARKRKAKKND